MEIKVVILGFDHDELTLNSESGKMAGITFGLKSCLTSGLMHETNTSAGGWKSCICRTYVLQSLFDLLPMNLRQILKCVNKLTSAGVQSSNIEKTADYLFLFSHKEVFGTFNRTLSQPFSFNGEGEQYQFFKDAIIPSPNSGSGKFLSLNEGAKGTFYTNDLNSSNGYKNKFMEDKSTAQNVYYNFESTKSLLDDKVAIEWWIRSPSCNFTTGYCTINPAGMISYNMSTKEFGICFGFCV